MIDFNRFYIDFKKFYNATDTSNTRHMGFLQGLDLSADIGLLNEVTLTILDGYIFNNLKNKPVLNQWAICVRRDGLIDTAFYNDYPLVLNAELMLYQPFYDLKRLELKSLSANELETIEYGAREKDKEYDTVVLTINRGKDIESIGARIDTETVGALHGTTTNSVLGQVHPYDTASFVDDSNRIESGTTDQDAQNNQSTQGAQSNTYTHGTITNTTDGRTDSEVIKAHIDTHTRTKHVILSPDKFFEIQKELAELNAYKMILDAINKTMCKANWGGV